MINKDTATIFAEVDHAIDEARWNDAVSLLRPLCVNKDIYALGKLAFCLSQAREYEEAVTVLTDLCERQQAERRWPYMIGFQYYQQEQWEQAVTWFGKALMLCPTYIKVLYRKGYAHMRLGQDAEALTLLAKSIHTYEQAPQDAQDANRKYFGKASFQFGKLLLKKGRFERALGSLETAARLQAQDPDAHYEHGACLLKLRRYDDAIAALQVAERLKPRTDYIVDRLAQAYAGKGDHEAAARTYRLIPDGRGRSFVLQHQGEWLLTQGDHSRAARFLELAARKQRDNHNIQYALGRAFQALGDFRKAEKSYAAAIRLRQQNYKLAFPEAAAALELLKEQIASLPPEQQDPASPMPEEKPSKMGVIASYNQQRGFGFIQSTDAGQSIFFHVTTFVGRGKPQQGAKVHVMAEATPRGLRALKVEEVQTSNN